MLLRIVARLGTLTLLAAAPAFAQEIDQDEGEAGCVYNRQVYPGGAELCQDGTLKRCEEGSWEDMGACRAGPEQAPISEGGDVVESED